MNSLICSHRNTRRNGEWIFQIGGEGVKRSQDVREPENVRTVKRQLVLNVQEVDCKYKRNALR